MKYTERELSKVGVEIVDHTQPSLRCKVCGQQWQPMIQPGGTLPRRYWQCPTGCNADAGKRVSENRARSA